jgi:Ca2+-binding EF-hand superfamily protein
MSVNKELEKLYYNPKTGFISGTKLYKMAKELRIKTTQKEINKFLEK